MVFLLKMALATTYTVFLRRRSSSAPSDRTSLSSSALLCKEPWIYTTENHPPKTWESWPECEIFGTGKALGSQAKWVFQMIEHDSWANSKHQNEEPRKHQNGDTKMEIPWWKVTIFKGHGDHPSTTNNLVTIPVPLWLPMSPAAIYRNAGVDDRLIVATLLLVYIKQHPDIPAVPRFLLHWCCDFYFWVTLQGMLLLNITARARCTRCTLLPQRVYSSFLHVKQFVSPSPTRRRYKAWVNAGTDNSDHQEDFWKRLQLLQVPMTLLSCATPNGFADHYPY